MQSIDDIYCQARQGSIAAIIQILNDKLADSSIRTRAVLDQGVLQLLCEAPSPEQLPQDKVVSRVKTLLEGMSPRSISRVNINGRIVQEQQLLWLDEIKRDPETQLLWSEQVALKKPNPAVRLWQDMRLPRQRGPYLDVPASKTGSSSIGFWRGLMGGISLCLFLVLLGWVVRDWLGWANGPFAGLSNTEQTTPAAAPAPEAIDPFAQAVRIAQQAAEAGQTASTAAEWLELASRWQRASDLMAEVMPEDARYGTAQERVQTYRQNSGMALRQSEQLQGTPEPAAP
ncbi:MAG: hypothetical protein ICV62_11505 [Cyanobacteria bacterium Co-bin13]|nr:hypothetical protein [Cyanobacteria bacterium Co-bin13]